MTIVNDNIENHRQMYIISCMNVPKQSQLDQKNEKLFMMCTRDDVKVERVALRIYSFLRLLKHA